MILHVFGSIQGTLLLVGASPLPGGRLSYCGKVPIIKLRASGPKLNNWDSSPKLNSRDLSLNQTKVILERKFGTDTHFSVHMKVSVNCSTQALAPAKRSLG